MKRIAAFALLGFCSIFAVGCDDESQLLDGTQWTLVSEDGGSIRYVEFTRGQIREYTHNEADDCYEWATPIPYEETLNDPSMDDGNLTLTDGTFSVAGQSLSEIFFIIDDDTLTLSPVSSTDPIGGDTANSDVWEEADFTAGDLTPRCTAAPTPTPTPTPSPTPTPTPSPTPR